jgi:hypothetical protein
MVNASSSSDRFSNHPTAVQLPGVAQDTEVNLAEGEAF